MQILENIKEAVEKVIEYANDNKKIVKIAATTLIVVIAVFLFASKNGEQEQISFEEGGNIIEENGGSNREDKNQETEGYIKKYYADIGGAVKNPGVYSFDNGERVFAIIEKAGGLTDEADTSMLNQAQILTDGQKIYIPSKVDSSETEASSGLININFANSNTLEDIPGVGPSTAAKIIKYREEKGHFTKIEDIMNVDGIGQKTFENMKDYITV